MVDSGKGIRNVILVKGTKERAAAFIILCGSSNKYTDEMERSIHDALCVFKCVLKTPTGALFKTLRRT